MLISRAHLAIAGLTVMAAVAPAAEEPIAFAGQVYDLDFSLGRDRVVVMMLSGGNTLVAETSHPAVLGVLETAMTTGLEAGVTYGPGVPNRILSVRLSLKERVRVGRVQELAYVEQTGHVEARILLEDGEVVVTTKDLRAQAILQAAMREGRPLEDVQYDPETRVLDRVKLRVMR